MNPATKLAIGNPTLCFFPCVSGYEDIGNTWQLCWKNSPQRDCEIGLSYCRIPITIHSQWGSWDFLMLHNLCRPRVRKCTAKITDLVRSSNHQSPLSRSSYLGREPAISFKLSVFYIYVLTGFSWDIWQVCVKYDIIYCNLAVEFTIEFNFCQALPGSTCCPSSHNVWTDLRCRKQSTVQWFLNSILH